VVQTVPLEQDPAAAHIDLLEDRVDRAAVHRPAERRQVGLHDLRIAGDERRTLWREPELVQVG
jgi:hypothetical protein